LTLHVIGNTTRDIFYLTESFPLPGESVLAAERKEDVGGKGFNQAVAATYAGAQVNFTTPLGNDTNAKFLRKTIYSIEGMTAKILTAPFVSDESIIVISSDSENSIVTTADCANWPSIEMLKPSLELINPDDMLLMQGNMDFETTKAGIIKAKERGAICILNPAPLMQNAALLASLADIIVLNLVEACAILGQFESDITNTASAIAQGKMLQEQSGSVILLTLGSKGCVIFSDEEFIEISAPRVDAVDTTGAGDTFIGWFCAGYIEGLSLRDAVKKAVNAAALTVTRLGTGNALPTKEDYAQFLRVISK
tara:strand:+ start:405 stop:1331 length:927 start_codon:yes stop_codon:yes gene_type:complete